jgi:predicted N-formylglutamate amidohydrolase
MNETTVQPEILNADVTAPLILLCEHASNFVPDAYQQLGLPDEELNRHIAWDIGAGDVTRKMAELMKVPAVLGTSSRLLIDPNREPDHLTLVPSESDGTLIPANRDMNKSAIEARKKAFYTPFHSAADALIDQHLEDGVVPIIAGIHSFTPEMNGEPRPWQIGFLWNKDPRLAQAMIGLVERETDLTVGDNQPYSGQDLYYTMQRHGADRGLPQTTIEIRQDLLVDASMVLQWAALLADLLDECMERDDLCRVQHY